MAITFRNVEFSVPISCVSHARQLAVTWPFNGAGVPGAPWAKVLVPKW